MSIKQKKELKKISDVEYTGSKKTFTQELTPEEIKNLLEGYEEVEYNELKRGFHIRYFSKNKEGKMGFKMGGNIIKLNIPDYIVLTNGKVNWSVQINNSTFYQQLTMTQIKDDIEREYKAELFIKDKEILKLKDIIKSLKKK